MPTARPPFGVLLVNLGTPKAPTPAAVREYLAEFLWDRRVVDAPRPLWWLILNGIILRTRPGRVAKAYQSVWRDDGSPLMHYSLAQQAALRVELQQRLGTDIPVALAMTYGEPNMEQAGAELRKAGVEKIVVLPLYPQFSGSTTGAVHDRLAKGLQRCPHLPEMHWVMKYFDHPLYIKALGNSVREYWAEHGRGDRLLMSFHGIPERYERNGDPYPRQCRQTAAALAAELGLADNQWLCSFQSRFGREEWVKPYTDKTLESWGADKIGRVDVISPAFASDCLETLEELDVENRHAYMHAGGSDYHYIPCLNDKPDHIALLATLVEEHSRGWI
ncbi:ferrochelatase [Parathalassolituus penaei]|uniref:Ferrochelatase n=1 Tax=Parathalassolituus penaei TaxID=2997323 RepID=A0A9X3ISM0_9GAMM|nr:ferrochelatase [Parathalassolituus penaei]MCY0965976.1 ferrochelatase [Parathalassolituus penaei]